MYSFMIAAAAGHVCHCGSIKTRETKDFCTDECKYFWEWCRHISGETLGKSVEIQVFARSTVTYWYFRFFFINLKHVLWILLKWSAICFKSCTWTVHFSNSTRLSVTKRLDLPVRRCSERGGTLIARNLQLRTFCHIVGSGEMVVQREDFAGKFIIGDIILHCWEWWDGCAMREGLSIG